MRQALMPTNTIVQTIAGAIRQLGRDIRFGFGGLRRRPSFAATGVLSVAVGIAATATVLSVASTLFLRPLPYPQPQRLVAIWPEHAAANREIAALRARARSFDIVAALSPGWLFPLTSERIPVQVNAGRVTGNVFPLLGVAPIVGRPFGVEAEAAGRDKVVVLGYDLWQSLFNADPRIVGRSIMLGGARYTVVAVMPRGFTTFETRTDLWIPLTMDQAEFTWTGPTALMFGRLRGRTTVAQASAELRVLATRMQQEFHLTNQWATDARVASLQDTEVASAKTSVSVVMGAVALLMLIAIANVANLFLVRTAERRQELAVRAALGASRGQIAALLIGEALALGMVAGAIGISLAYAGLGLLRRILPANFPRLAEISIDGRVLGAAVLIALCASLIAGVAPSIQGLASRLSARLRNGRTIAGAGGSMRGSLVAAEMALAVMLTIGAGLMGRTLVALDSADRGLRSDHLLTMRLQPALSKEAARPYWRDVLSRVQTVPGVVSAGTILHLPASGRQWQADIEIDGRPVRPGESLPRAAWQSVSAGYFATAGMRMLRGRAFTSRDGPNMPRVVVLNDALSRRLFPGEDPIGRRIRGGPSTGNEWATVVGTVQSVRQDSLNAPPPPELYLPFEQTVVGANSLVVRTAVDPVSVAPAIRDRIWEVDRNVPISDVRTMDDVFSGSLQRQRMTLTLFGVFAGIGLLLSMIGVYGVVAYGVRQRVRELAVRVALGAGSASIQRLVLGEGLRHGAAGVAVGLCLAAMLSGYMRGMIYGVPAIDPATFAVVAIILLIVAAGASWIPARTAARADPCVVLRDLPN
jgi:putative ABC transport system permease protein